jgi:hypothetical protein
MDGGSQFSHSWRGKKAKVTHVAGGWRGTHQYDVMLGLI